MGSSQTITVFSSIPSTGQRSSSFLLSVLMHGAAAGLIYTGIVLTPRLAPPLDAHHYALRRLDLHQPEQHHASGGSAVAYPGPVEQTARVAQSSSPAPGAASHAPAPPLPETADAAQGKQTLVQPDVRKPVVLAEKVPLPNVVIWSPEKAPVKTIVPPQAQKPTASDVTPSIDPPNEEVNLSDLGVSATDLAAQNPVIPPSTTSPVIVRAPDLVQLPPVTTSDATAEPTPVTIMSLSDLRIDDGTVTLPPANQTAPANAPGSLAAGQAQNAAMQSNAGPPGAAGAQSGQNDAALAPAAVANPSAGQAAAGAGQNPGAGAGAAAPSATVINLPHDGQFGAVVVGDSVNDEFPEITSLWSSRMAYTVYLHVGLAKSWILQYSLPAAAEAAVAGEVARIEAPWPFNIVRPNIPSGSVDADALMIHGYVNQSGRFDSLSVAFPSDYAQARFVLGSLQQWQFRPAAQNGQPVRVEVLLIIPQDED